jgi:hypothetical protein
MATAEVTVASLVDVPLGVVPRLLPAQSRQQWSRKRCWCLRNL